jgi:tRNA pseudouridine38-40 synthase
LAYDGTEFRGWARQGDAAVRTVEGVVSDVLARILTEHVRLSVAGRTDAGVHARGQVVSFATSNTLAPERIRGALTSMLGPEVVAVDARVAPAGFDARFSASARIYRYVIDTAAVSDPFTARFVWSRPGELSLPAMRAGALHLVGEHDFTSFCRYPGVGKPTVRDLQQLAITRRGDRVELVVRSNAFLHQMVRTLVGTLVAVGEGRTHPADVAGILRARDRAKAGQPAPAKGLTLERVVYGRRGR